MFGIKYSKQALKDKDKLDGATLKNAKRLIDIIKLNPFQTPPKYEKLVGLKDQYSRRINKQHRLWYLVDKKSMSIRILRMWTHYE